MQTQPPHDDNLSGTMPRHGTEPRHPPVKASGWRAEGELKWVELKSGDLTGPALEWAVADCEGNLGHGLEGVFDGRLFLWADENHVSDYLVAYGTQPAQGQPILERERIAVIPASEVGRTESGVEFQLENGWKAYKPREFWRVAQTYHGPTLLIAGLRCYVASVKGDTVHVPAELVESAA